MDSLPRRVLMTADAVGGVWTYAVELARGLSDAGVEVLLAVMGGGVSDAHRFAAGRIRGLRLEVSDAKLEWMDEPWADVASAGEWLLRLARDFNPEIVHLNGYAHAALSWDCPVVVVAHSCVLSWFRAVRGCEAPLDTWGLYRDAVMRGLAAADVVIAPSDAMLAELRLIYGRLPRALVIPNGCDAARFFPGPKENIILAAGRAWDDAKNFRVLSEAAPSIGWPVLLAGASSFAGLQCLGVLTADELARWYARASIYALPALYEPFGLTALEAALSGCALVLSDIPSLREIWGDAALFVSPRDPAAWRDALNRLAANLELRLSLSKAARKRALAFSASAMVSRYLESYKYVRQNQTCASLSSRIRFDPTGTTETRTSFVA